MRPGRSAAGLAAVVAGLAWPPRLVVGTGGAGQSRALAGYGALVVALVVVLWVADEARPSRVGSAWAVLAPAALAGTGLCWLALAPRALGGAGPVVLVSAVVFGAVVLAGAVLWTGFRLRAAAVLPGPLAVLPAFGLLVDLLLNLTPYAPVGPISVSGLAWLLVGVALVGSADRPSASPDSE